MKLLPQLFYPLDCIQLSVLMSFVSEEHQLRLRCWKTGDMGSKGSRGKGGGQSIYLSFWSREAGQKGFSGILGPVTISAESDPHVKRSWWL